MTRRLLIIMIITGALILAVGIVCAEGIADRSSQNAAGEEASIEEQAPQPGRAELVINALAAAYPDRVTQTEFHDGDWALLLDGTWYYYAEGRLLPEAMRENADDYSSINFYNYQSELPPWGEPFPVNRNFNERTARSPRRQRSYFFHEAIWQTRSSREAGERVKTIKFLGFYPPVHSGIIETLALVEQRIMAAAETDPQVQAWVSSIGEIHGWNWRNVPSNQNRSYHSYGIALDILPKSLGGKETYWLWASQRGKSWWEIPYEDRYHPPDAVVKAFEAYGFVWGGKWVSYFDTMHFEYRPEVFILSGLELMRN